jgi:hypothetical protein
LGVGVAVGLGVGVAVGVTIGVDVASEIGAADVVTEDAPADAAARAHRQAHSAAIRRTSGGYNRNIRAFLHRSWAVRRPILLVTVPWIHLLYTYRLKEICVRERIRKGDRRADCNSPGKGV